MTKPVITKVQLVEQLNNWQQQKIDNEQLQDWMVTHFDPPEVEIGPTEAELVQEAMHVIMNEYELADTEKFLTEGYQNAMAFLECDEDNFSQRRHQFIHNSFKD